MRFSDLAKNELVTTEEAFGSYVYLNKGPEKVLNMASLVNSLKQLATQDILVELKHLSKRTDCPLDPIPLVERLMNELDKDEKYNGVFEDEELFTCCY